MSEPGPVKVLFASCRAERVPLLIDEFLRLQPHVPLVVVSEFPPPQGEWIPFHIRRGVRENRDLCRARLAGRSVVQAAVALDPERPYGRLRLLGCLMAPLRLLVFTENLTCFRLRPRELPAIVRYGLRRVLTVAVQPIRSGGWLHRWLWRLAHPDALRRPLYYRTALAGGTLARWRRKYAPEAPPVTATTVPQAEGISVVIPSRNGRELLAECLPPVLAQLRPGEVIVVDNGSEDDTAGFLGTDFPEVVVEHFGPPLSFARAVNRGIARARFSHICLLNNDMVVEEGFFDALRAAFDRVPGLFCATAQIFLPDGQRREETGKAVMPAFRAFDAFPVVCETPVEGEDHTYVLYGSGGASLYDTRKLRALGGVPEAYEPAYVEDLDLGFNGWRLGWPTVFAARARVLHRHRATTSRYYTAAELSQVLERNYLRFLARSVTGRELFASLWQEAIWRINAACPAHPELVDVLRQATGAVRWVEPRPPAAMPEQAVFAIGSGAMAVFPGRSTIGRPLVLVVSPYVPFPLSHGGAVRMYNLTRRAAAEFDLVLLCFTDELQAPPPELTAICSEVVYVKRRHTHAVPSAGRPDVVEEFDSPAFRAVLTQTVRKWRPAIVQLEFTQMAQYTADCAPAKTVLVEHDITLDLYAQLLEQREDWETRRQYDRWVRFERQAWDSVDRVVAMSGKDRRTIDRSHAVTLPNGVDIERFQPTAGAPEPEAPDPGRLLFIGSFAHLPNLLAIDFFLREAWPPLKALGARLHIIAGSRPEYYLDLYRQRVQPPLAQDGVELDGFVSDVRPAYRRAAVVIAPLLASAGTNIKIMEAMAMGKAIVSTPAGINGLDELENGRDVLVVKTGAEMAEAIAGLIRDSGRRRKMEIHARESAVRHYDWDVIGREQAKFYRSLL